MCFAAQWWEAFGGHCPELQKFAILVLSQTCSASGCERNWSVFERIHTKKRNCLDQKRLNDLVYVQYNLWLRRNHLLNKRPDSDPIVLEDIDPTSDWVVESRPAEFDPNEDLDLDLDMETSVEIEHVVQLQPVQLNADPNPPASVSQPARTPVVVAQPASGTTSTVAVGDDDDEEEEEQWGPLSDSDDDDPEIDRHDLGSSGSYH
eukprot:PITA_33969